LRVNPTAADMKVIGLFPVRNEEWILPTTLAQLRRFTDDIIALDGFSTDRSADLIRKTGGTVLTQDGRDPRYAEWRQTLLEAGRQRGGTHFIWLDADEAFTTPFLNTFRSRLAAMKPGQKLVMDWLALWKDARRIRSDDSVWSQNYKDFVFCDDGVSGFDRTKLHEGRTPGANTPDRTIRIPRAEGAVLHFQFTPFHRFQLKQAYVRGLELLQGKPAWRINHQYRITRDDPQARTEPIPDTWLEGLPNLDALAETGGETYLQSIRGFFEQKNIGFFEPLDIWHIPELAADFQRQMHRLPRIAYPPLLWTLYQHLKNTLRAWLPNR